MWPEIGLASLVTGLKNWLYLKNELMEWTDVCMVVQIQESKRLLQWLLGGLGQKMGVII